MRGIVAYDMLEHLGLPATIHISGLNHTALTLASPCMHALPAHILGRVGFATDLRTVAWIRWDFLAPIIGVVTHWEMTTSFISRSFETIPTSQVYSWHTQHGVRLKPAIYHDTFCPNLNTDFVSSTFKLCV